MSSAMTPAAESTPNLPGRQNKCCNVNWPLAVICCCRLIESSRLQPCCKKTHSCRSLNLLTAKVCSHESKAHFPSQWLEPSLANG
jgi:hypothetical protein